MLGYDPEWRSPKAIKEGKNPPSSARIIIPTSNTSYLARATSPDIDPQYKAMKTGSVSLFNKEALEGTEPVFVVEGEIDALSVIEAGGQSLALGSINYANKLIDLCRTTPPEAPLLLALDNDERGQKAQSRLRQELEAIGIAVLEVNISGECKDPNERLKHAPDEFRAVINDPYRVQRAEREEKKRAHKEKNSAKHILSEFMSGIKQDADTPAIPTGFKILDEALDGGLYEGLYIIGAISSLGKTTFALQIADKIAQQGEDVLIFSLEMSKYELIAKSISRLTFQNDPEYRGIKGKDVYYAKTNRQITAGAKYKNYDKREIELIKQSMSDYEQYSENLYIYEGVGNIGVEQIREVVQEHISLTGAKPMVLIDYLQILAPYEVRATDKQNTDKAVLELKRLSRDYKLPILIISSFNRDNYLSSVNMASFKESGAIEYSSDVLLGLQLAGMDGLSQSESKRGETMKQTDEWKQANPRKAQLKILKNRNGAIGGSFYYDYFPMFNYFQETDPPTETKKSDKMR